MTDLDDILSMHSDREGPLLPILHDVQKQFGHISEESIRAIATAQNLTRAEVYGVVSFYHDFKSKAEPKPVVKLCRAEACKARGVEALVPIAEGQSRVKVEAIYCLGLCAVGPAALVNDTVYARLDADAFSALLESA